MEDYVGNSHKLQAEERKKADKVIKGAVQSKHDSGVGKFVSNFLVNDAADILDYAWNELIVPGIKNSILDTIEMAMYDRRGGYGDRRGNRDRYYDYNRSYRDRDRRDRDRERDRRDRDDRYRDRDQDSRSKKPRLDDIVLSYEDANRVLHDLRDDIDEYGSVPVGNLYEKIGFGDETSHTDYSYGWYDLDNADMRYVSRDRYLLVLPKAKPLD